MYIYTRKKANLHAIPNEFVSANERRIFLDLLSKHFNFFFFVSHVIVCILVISTSCSNIKKLPHPPTHPVPPSCKYLPAPMKCGKVHKISQQHILSTLKMILKLNLSVNGSRLWKYNKLDRNINQKSTETDQIWCGRVITRTQLAIIDLLTKF